MNLRRNQSQKRRKKILAVLIALLLLGGGGFGYLQSQQTPFQTSPVQNKQPVERKKDDTEESTRQFAPLSEVPGRLIIDKIDVDAEIESLGLDEQGRMAAPVTNEGVGWYDQSAKAGETELAVLLDGHYGIGNKPGVFRRLDELQLGDRIKVQGAAGTVLEYKVVETTKQNISDVDMRKALFPYRAGVQSLTIITCEGTYDASQATYDKRTVLYAERVR